MIRELDSRISDGIYHPYAYAARRRNGNEASSAPSDVGAAA